MLKDSAISEITMEPIVSELLDLTQYTLKQTKLKGASAAEVSTGIYKGICVNARLRKLETIEYSKEKGITITAYFGRKKGSSSTTDINLKSLNETINAACSIAKTVSEDPYSGLADPELLAFNYPDLDLYHPWNIAVEDLVKQAIHCEEYALDLDNKITNSEGVSISSYQSYYIYGNTNNFIGHYPTTKHRASCVLVAGDSCEKMQRDYYYSVSRDLRKLESYEEIAKQAVNRTIKRLQSRSLSTRKVPVIFNADIASSLFGCLLSAISGNNQYRKSSFLYDKIDTQVMPSWISMQENPHLSGGLGSHPFDSEGVATKDNYFIKDGVIHNYILDSYTARRLSLTTTGNGSGVSNLCISNNGIPFSELLKEMDTGLLVTELLGHGINITTGDYSQGAAGFWVENGEIQYPVEEITIAGNLKDIFLNIVRISNDIDYRKNILVGSTLIDQMTVAG